MAGRLGKKPFVADKRDLKLEAVEVALPPMPRQPFGFGTLYADWAMLGNDNYGDCVFASGDHQTMLWNKVAGHPVAFTAANALSDYSAVTGFDPNDPNTDQGTEVRTALGYRKATGLIDAAGKRHKIDAYVQIAAKDWETMIRCVWTFGVVEIGFEFPDSAMSQFDAGKPWDVVAGASIEGGHDVPIVGYPGVDQATCVTWGRRQVLTRAFYETYNDEAWVPLTKESLLPASNVRHIDWTHLTALLGAL